MAPKKKVDIKAQKAKAIKDDQPKPKSKGKAKKEPSPPKRDPSPQPPKGRGKKKAPVDEPKATKADTKEDKAKDEEKIVKVVTKGGAAVDNLVPNKDQFRVYQDSNNVYSATLNQADLQHNNNKFYIVQVLLNEKNGQFNVWNRWGRVGVPGQNCLKGPFPKDGAIAEYNSKIHDKTKKGNYTILDIKYDEDQEKPKKEETKKKSKNVASKMDMGLQRFINLIFDVNIMNSTMKEIGYDAKKIPLGKLGESTIKEAYQVLNSLSKALKKNDKNQITNLSSRFYSLIPHDVGFKNMAHFVLDNDEKVKEKLKTLETISDMKITTKLLDEGDDEEDTAVLDQNYKKLGCKVTTLDTKSADYKLMKEYFDNTKGGFTNVKVGDIYEVNRPTEMKSYNEKIGNNMLLWHGSRISNFVGILSQGLRIAPPQAPVSGYLFGKGIYLADMAEKSIHYCRSHGSDKALILLIEGAIGNPNILLHSNCNAKELMEQAKKDSTKCHGSKAPPESCYVNHKKMIIPNGKAQPTGSGSYMGHNEFIVYNMNQARIRYIIQMDMK